MSSSGSQRRWTVPDIAARLLPVSPAPKKKAWTRYRFPAVAAGVALIVLLAGSKLLNHGPQIRPSSPPRRTAGRLTARSGTFLFGPIPLPLPASPDHNPKTKG